MFSLNTLTASIFSEVLGGNPLNVIYAAALFIGVLYASFLMFFHDIGSLLGDLGLDVHLDLLSMAHAGHLDLHAGAGHEAANVSTLAIASFISSFGAFGLIAVTLFDAGAVASLVAALSGGIVFGIAAQLFFLYILSPTVSSEVQQARLIGQVAEITTPIPVNGVGQIAFVAQGGRVTYSARATDTTIIVERGTPVRIERLVGGLAYVSKID
jgi:membrane protein implicated in regulation of membrane protease activity